jgi:hypothetical protein
MSSYFFDGALSALCSAGINPTTDTVKMMLVSVAPNRATMVNRSDVTNEVTGTGYTSGGAACTVTPALNTTTHQEVLTTSSVTWTTATISAVGAVLYKSTGTASTDRLYGYLDFGGTVTSTGGNFTVNSDTLTLQG